MCIKYFSHHLQIFYEHGQVDPGQGGGYRALRQLCDAARHPEAAGQISRGFEGEVQEEINLV